MDQSTHMLDHILENEKKMNARMSEADFKNVILPILAQKETTNATLEPWLHVTGSWVRGIDVIDDKGEILFKVPALVATTKIPKIGDARDSAFEAIETAKKKMVVNPRGGAEYLTDKLNENMIPDGDHDHNRQLWNFIFDRYGLEHLIVGDVKSVDSTTDNSKDKPDSIEGYDDI